MNHICFFIGNISLSGGTERVSTTIANGFVLNGYKVSFLSLWGDGNSFFELDKDIASFSLFNKKKKFSKIYHQVVFKLRRFLKEHNIDTLINVESMLELYTIPAIIGLNIRNICWEHFNYHSDLGSKMRRIARHLAAAFADDVITLTDRDTSFWRENTWCRANIKAISNPSSFPIQNHHEPKIKNKLVLAVGRLTSQKGFDLLLDAWSKIISQIPAGWRLRIVGNGSDEVFLKKKCKSLDLEKNVEWIPSTTDIAQHYREASIYCLSSRFEGLPMVMLEAIAFGLPIVAFDCNTGPAEIISHGKSGFLCESSDVNALADALLNMILSSDESYMNFVSHAFLDAERFTNENILNIWKDLLIKYNL